MFNDYTPDEPEMNGENKMKIKCKQIKEFIKDEKQGIKDYRKAGFKKLAKDESRHLKYLSKIKKKVCE